MDGHKLDPNVRVEFRSGGIGNITEGRPVMMHIGELAERTGMSLRTIRHYDEVGLLKPTGRTDGGFRLYTDADFGRLMLIRRMKPLGYTLEEMGDLLNAIDSRDGDADPATQASLQAFRDDAADRRRRLQVQLEMADEFIDLLRLQQSRPD
jgi:MerR family copper efflux transcriptional regulator